MAKWLLSAALTLMTFPSSAIAQTKESLVGTWKLVSVTDTTDKGEVKHSLGENPTGLLIYTVDGKVLVFLVTSTEEKFSIPLNANLTVELA
ncbi:MAG TPA: lipocalin-like domain-containing protein, partial [Candidatus Acidoferrales bacterium]|nr:lipocalin-like domain-containing protein [Candidatus Acidoferrales bacterium]